MADPEPAPGASAPITPRPGFWRRIAAKAWQAADPEHPQSTLRLFQELVPYMDQEDPEALFQLASAYYFADHYLQAQLFVEFALDRGLDEENRPLAHLMLIDSLRSMDRGTDALDRIQAAAREFPGQPMEEWLLVARIKTLHSMGRDDEVTQIAIALATAKSQHHARTSRGRHAASPEWA